jgi:hypothetical protein
MPQEKRKKEKKKERKKEKKKERKKKKGRIGWLLRPFSMRPVLGIKMCCCCCSEIP